MDRDTARTRIAEEIDRLRRLVADQTESGELDEGQQGSLSELSTVDQHPADIATDTFERTKALAIQNQLRAEIMELEEALERVETEKYGRCETCGDDIDSERLQIRPAARYCVDHQPADQV